MIANAATAVRIEISGASTNRNPIEVRRAELLLGQQLEDVGERLQRAVGPDAVGAVARLEAPEQLALGEQHDRHELQAHGEDHDRLEDLDPPFFVVADDREAHQEATAVSRSCQRTPRPPISSSVRPA